MILVFVLTHSLRNMIMQLHQVVDADLLNYLTFSGTFLCFLAEAHYVH